MADTQISTTATEALGTLFISALQHREYAALAEVFHPNVRCRLLIPRGLLTPSRLDGLQTALRQWFGDADHFTVENSDVRLIGECLHVAYHIRLREHGRWFRVEQQTFSRLQDGRIEQFDLLCSGFEPDPSTDA